MPRHPSVPPSRLLWSTTLAAWLKFVPQPCQMPRSATVNTGAPTAVQNLEAHQVEHRVEAVLGDGVQELAVLLRYLPLRRTGAKEHLDDGLRVITPSVTDRSRPALAKKADGGSWLLLL